MKEMKVKHGARPLGLKSVMYKAWDYYADLCELCGIEPVLTDGLRDPKERYSLHQDGYAIDVRLRDLHVDKGMVFKRLMQKHLGNDFDVIYYSETSKHLHIEYQRHLDDQKMWNITNTQINYVS